MNEAIVALRRLVKIADELIPANNPSNAELAEAEQAICAAYAALNDCTCDEHGSAGCPRHDEAVKRENHRSS